MLYFKLTQVIAITFFSEVLVLIFAKGTIFPASLYYICRASGKKRGFQLLILPYKVDSL